MSLCHIHGRHLFITFWRKEMASSNTNHSNFWYKERNRTLKLTNVTEDFWAGKPEMIWLKVWNRGICVVFSSRVLQGAMVSHSDEWCWFLFCTSGKMSNHWKDNQNGYFLRNISNCIFEHITMFGCRENQYWNGLFFVAVYLSKCELILFNFL